VKDLRPQGPDAREPALRSALCVLVAACGILWLSQSRLALAAGASSAPLEVSCTQIRDAVHGVAAAERNQALALHLMAGGKPTPVVQTRLTELQAQIENLRGILRRARKGASRKNTDLQECIALGSRSLRDAENISRQIQDVVMGEDGEFALPA